jgi:UDP-N-acetylglucosamine--N-acetylmuramyl-(pentapeptide) pyrophosphoryl-undecaprenol N-acetylglucosamine transferase
LKSVQKRNGELLVKLLVCAGGTGGGVYPALAVFERLASDHSTEVLWVGSEGGMEADLVRRAGINFATIPAAGVHGVGLRALPGNLARLMRGYGAARKLLQEFKPHAMFFTGGYVAGPVALAGRKIPTAIYVPDIEPGLALKLLARFADRIAVTAENSRQYFPQDERVVVTGYPVRAAMSTWELAEAYPIFGFSAELPTLLVTGGSLGALSINKALTAALPELLREMQIVHLTGARTWDQFKDVAATLAEDLRPRYRAYPYLHEEMGAAFSIADLVVSRAGASSIGEYPHFGIPAILVPYPHAWRYQKVNADYLAKQGAAKMLEDEHLGEKLSSLILDLIRDNDQRTQMRQKMQSLANSNAATDIAAMLKALASE